MNADRTRSGRVQGGVQDLAKGVVHVGPQIADRSCVAEKKGYLSHVVLSGPMPGPAGISTVHNINGIAGFS